jgi:hypothetical protein
MSDLRAAIEAMRPYRSSKQWGDALDAVLALIPENRYVVDDHADGPHRHEGGLFVYPWDEPQWSVAPHPGEPHEFRTMCYRCGERGILHVAVITPSERVRVEDRG